MAKDLRAAQVHSIVEYEEKLIRVYAVGSYVESEQEYILVYHVGAYIELEIPHPGDPYGPKVQVI